VAATARSSAVILLGAIAARTVMTTIDLVAARSGGTPGGEITLPIYAIILPSLGWYLRGVWHKYHQKGKRSCITESADDVVRTTTPVSGVPVKTKKPPPPTPVPTLYQERE
jgi:hypothetical protein